MRIALIASSLRRAGAEKQFVYMARALWQAGVDVRVFYLGEGDYYQGVLIDAGIPFRQIFSRDRPLKMLACLVKEMSAFKPHIVLASQFGDLIFAAFAGRLCRALVLGGVRSDGLYELRSAGRRAWPLLSLTHGLIANSHRARENLISKGTDPRKIALLPNVIDLSDFDSKAAKPLPGCLASDRIRIAAIGSLQPCKRFDRFVAALAWARQEEPALFGLIAGDNFGEKSALEREAAALGLFPGHLQFLGDCNYIPALLAHSRLLVLCSDYEGFPNVILEAMAARLPVVATPVGDVARIVEHEVTGYVLQPDDNQAMGQHIARLALNPSLAVQMGEAGRKRVEQNYNSNALAERLMSIFSTFARARGKIPLLKLLEQRAANDISQVPATTTTARLASAAAAPT
jgi:glycosyltransferase involved in cell wall biosynthesis